MIQFEIDLMILNVYLFILQYFFYQVRFTVSRWSYIYNYRSFYVHKKLFNFYSHCGYTHWNNSHLFMFKPRQCLNLCVNSMHWCIVRSNNWRVQSSAKSYSMHRWTKRITVTLWNVPCTSRLQKPPVWYLIIGYLNWLSVDSTNCDLWLVSQCFSFRQRHIITFNHIFLKNRLMRYTFFHFFSISTLSSPTLNSPYF